MIRRYVVSENKAPWYANDTKKKLQCQKDTEQYWIDCFPLYNCSAVVYGKDAGKRRAVCGAVLACQSLQSLQSTHQGFGVQIQAKFDLGFCLNPCFPSQFLASPGYQHYHVVSWFLGADTMFLSYLIFILVVSANPDKSDYRFSRHQWHLAHLNVTFLPS